MSFIASYQNLKASDYKYYLTFDEEYVWVHDGIKKEKVDDQMVEYLMNWCMHSIGKDRFVYEMIDRDFEGF